MRQAVTRSESTVLAEAIAEIDPYLTRTLRSLAMPEILAEAIRYTVLDGGKRLRPALVLLSCDAVGGDRANALGPAVAIELIHNFSLVHDDLPAMDDDVLRRGRPTLHVQAGEAVAVLAGDAMVSLAFDLLSRTPIAPKRVAQLVTELASATTGMISGQVYDTVGGFPPELTDEQRLLIVHRNKTGALLRAACRMGAICGGSELEDSEPGDSEPGTSENEAIEALDAYGAAIGLMFQIVDDLLDVTQSPEHIGKATGKDLAAGKLTFPGVLGIERSRAEVSRLRETARAAVEGLGAPAEPLRALCDDMAIRTK